MLRRPAAIETPVNADGTVTLHFRAPKYNTFAYPAHSRWVRASACTVERSSTGEYVSELMKRTTKRSVLSVAR